MIHYQYTELFHLVFLKYLTDKISHSLFSLKGGCNLRFYFKSIRYSEDIDFDIHTLAVDTLKGNIRRIFSSKTFLDFLRSRGLEIGNVSEAKQTETTQRWKITLKILDSVREIPTKIEFSRRDSNLISTVEPIDQSIISQHELYPIISPHYQRREAISQKIAALRGRSETQARDIFDLSLLMSDIKEYRDLSLTQHEIGEAQERAMSLDFDQFKSQVVVFLAPEYQQYYAKKEAWERIMNTVVEKLEDLYS